MEEATRAGAASAASLSSDTLGLILHPPGAAVELVRALRLRLVSKAFFSAVADILSNVAALDLRGCPVRVLQRPGAIGLRMQGLRSVTIDCADLGFESEGVDLAPLPSALTSLTLRSGSLLSDGSLAASLESLPAACALRTLRLHHCSALAEHTLRTLRVRHASRLLTLDMRGCQAALRRPLMLEAVFRACSGSLQRLNLSGSPVDVAVLGSVLLTLHGLLELNLDACSLAGVDLCCSGDDGDDQPREARCLPSAELWRRLRRLRMLSLADNPEMSALAVASVVCTLPALCHLELSSSDFWAGEVEALIGALSTAPALTHVGCMGCDWLTAQMVQGLQRRRGGGLVVIHEPSKLAHENAALPATIATAERARDPSPAVANANAAESWEELEMVSVPSLSPSPSPSPDPGRGRSSRWWACA